MMISFPHKKSGVLIDWICPNVSSSIKRMLVSSANSHNSALLS